MAATEAIALEAASDARRLRGRLRLRRRRRLVEFDQAGGGAMFAFLVTVLEGLATAGTVGHIRAVRAGDQRAVGQRRDDQFPAQGAFGRGAPGRIGSPRSTNGEEWPTAGDRLRRGADDSGEGFEARRGAQAGPTAEDR